MPNLAGKAAIVTGAAKGIGAAIARRFVEEGAYVAIADVSPVDGAATAATLGPLAQFIACDVGDAASVKAMVDEAVGAFGGVDVLVNNAGIVANAEFLDLAEADFDRVMRVNIKGAFLVGQAVARHMVERVKAGGKPGAIVNMSSVNAVFAIATQVPYSVSKGGMNQLTKVMALALAPHGIRVNAIGPGSIMTEMLHAVVSNPEAMNRVMSRLSSTLGS